MHNIRSFQRMLVAVAAAGTVMCVPILSPSLTGIANAQEVTQTLSSRPRVNPDSQMLLESDDLIFDNDNQKVIATGNVQIVYNGHTLTAQKVTYDRKSGRVFARGSVEILQPSGNRIFADQIDLTDDFSDGFIGALNVETPDETRIAAESAERVDGKLTRFNNAVYTACKACEDNPEKPPFWQIRAKKVTINNATRAIEYEDASFEFFGVPVLRLSRFSHADPSIKRKSGFLMPTYGSSDVLGQSVNASYFFNLAPNYDLTVGERYYSRQGFLTEAEWRHRTETGSYSIVFAGIDQKERTAFASTLIDSENDERAAVGTRGEFNINSRWTFGWNALIQSDKNFARTYDINGFSDYEITNEIYLRGLSGKNYFDLAAQDFIVQNSSVLDYNRFSPGRQTIEDLQAKVLPTLDYNLVSDEEDGPGQLSFDFNLTNLSRSTSQIINSGLGTSERFHGISGEYSRASLNLEWKESTIVGGGALITTSLGVRGDGIQVNSDSLATASNPLTTNESIFRTMPNAMLEIRYPMIASTSMATHMFEPIAQIVTRPDETHIGLFPNEDAQSLVFDASNLFNQNKFSGYDRVEGGTRANLGFRYSTTFDTGTSIDIVAGQSFHLAGTNSFAQNDLVNVGMESGLETNRSDYVGSIAVKLPSFNAANIELGTSGRFDEKTQELRRGEIGAKYSNSRLSLNTSYIFTDAQPNYALATDRHEINTNAGFSFVEHWKAFGNITYDIKNDVVISDGIGLAYDDECYTFSLAYTHSRPRTGESVSRTISFAFGLRTIGGYNYSHNLDDGQ